MLLFVRRRRGRVLFKATPGSLPGGSTFTRSTTGTYKDTNGTRQTAAINTIRSGHFIGGVQSILLEGASTNHFLQSGTPATQTTPSLGTGTYTLWMEGTGSIAVSAGTATITGAGSASAGVPVTFVVTVAGTVTYTVTGSPTLAQAENLAFPSSYIPTTTVAVTRGADSLSFPFAAAPQAMTVYTKYVEGSPSLLGGLWLIGDGSLSTDHWRSQNDSATAFESRLRVSGVESLPGTTTATRNSGDTTEVRATLTAPGVPALTASVNAGTETTSTVVAGQTLPAVWSAQKLWVGALGPSNMSYAAFQSVKIAAGVRSLAEMRNL